jgi:hypothetical protein
VPANWLGWGASFQPRRATSIGRLVVLEDCRGAGARENEEDYQDAGAWENEGATEGGSDNEVRWGEATTLWL